MRYPVGRNLGECSAEQPSVSIDAAATTNGEYAVLLDVVAAARDLPKRPVELYLFCT